MEVSQITYNKLTNLAIWCNEPKCEKTIKHWS